MTDDFTHLDEGGRARMVDVSEKQITRRTATARSQLQMTPDTARRLADGRLPKGDALAVARVAGVMAAKRTPELIPLCHPLPLTGVAVTVDVDVASGIATVEATVRTEARTGVEMEAMVAAGVAAFALYDMVKGIDRGAEVSSVAVIHKAGGATGDWRRE